MKRGARDLQPGRALRAPPNPALPLPAAAPPFSMRPLRSLPNDGACAQAVLDIGAGRFEPPAIGFFSSLLKRSDSRKAAAIRGLSRNRSRSR